MCLILFSYQNAPSFSLKLLANRDEFYVRPTESAHWWKDIEIFGGRDLKEKGTWFGVARTGHFCAVTNIRDPKSFKENAEKSRGHLVTEYLKSEIHPELFIKKLYDDLEHYNDFNLLMSYRSNLYCFSSKARVLKPLEPGIHGLSNDSLNIPWPKVLKGKQQLSELIENGWDADGAFEILKDETHGLDEDLPETGVGIDKERLLSPIFIKSPIYGTRSSVVLDIVDNKNVFVEERDYVNKKTVQTQFKTTR